MLKDELLIISAYKGMEQTIFKLCAQMNISRASWSGKWPNRPLLPR